MQKKAQNYKDLVVWQKGITLAKAIYKLPSTFPAEEKFGLVAQMRRAAVSIPSTLRKGKRVIPQVNSFNSFPTPKAQPRSLRRN
jgi:hypothetical protein